MSSCSNKITYEANKSCDLNFEITKFRQVKPPLVLTSSFTGIYYPVNTT